MINLAVKGLTLSSLNLPLSSPLKTANCCRNYRLVVDVDDLKWLKNLRKLDVSVYHVNTKEGSPSHFSNKSYTLIIILADNQFVHVIIK